MVNCLVSATVFGHSVSKNPVLSIAWSLRTLSGRLRGLCEPCLVNCLVSANPVWSMACFFCEPCPDNCWVSVEPVRSIASSLQTLAVWSVARHLRTLSNQLLGFREPRLFSCPVSAIRIRGSARAVRQGRGGGVDKGDIDLQRSDFSPTDSSPAPGSLDGMARRAEWPVLTVSRQWPLGARHRTTAQQAQRHCPQPVPALRVSLVRTVHSFVRCLFCVPVLNVRLGSHRTSFRPISFLCTGPECQAGFALFLSLIHI